MCTLHHQTQPEHSEDHQSALREGRYKARRIPLLRQKPDAQVPMETVRLSDDTIDEYEDSRGSDQTESDTEPDAEDDDITDATGAGLRHWSRTADKQTNNRVSTVRVSTTSGSQEAALVRRTPAARGGITPGRAYTPPVLPSSSVAR